jgi:hypothetical protein
VNQSLELDWRVPDQAYATPEQTVDGPRLRVTWNTGWAEV